MAGDKWHRVENVAEFLSRGRKIKGEHAFTERALHWPYCRHCGLVALKNDASRRAAKEACVRLED